MDERGERTNLFWSKGDGRGDNVLGRLLMDLRAERAGAADDADR
jgi:predicted NAD-dependent protein-ADP-ribosyltransferase YbiA (DUF1768 family)